MPIVQHAENVDMMLKNAFCTKGTKSLLFIPYCNDFVTPFEQSIRPKASRKNLFKPHNHRGSQMANSVMLAVSSL